MKQICAVLAAAVVLLAGCVASPVSTPTPTSTAVSVTPSSVASTGSTADSSTSTRAPLTSFSGTLEGDTPTNNGTGFALTAQQIDQLDALIAGYDGRIAVGYCDIESGYRYVFGAAETFKAASIMKAPFCRYVLGVIEQQDTIRLTDTMVYTETYYTEGTGVIKDAEFGTVYTLEELIKLAIRRSDNIAFKMLRTVFPPSGFRQFAADIGIRDTAGIQNVANSNISAEDAITYMLDIAAYIGGGTDGGEALKEHMLNTRYPLITSPYPVIRKHGWMDGAYHDIAIIDAPHPYVLVILTNRDQGTNEDKALFREIAAAVDAVAQK